MTINGIDFADYGSEGWGFDSLMGHLIIRHLQVFCGCLFLIRQDHARFWENDLIRSRTRFVFLTNAVKIFESGETKKRSEMTTCPVLLPYHSKVVNALICHGWFKVLYIHLFQIIISRTWTIQYFDFGLSDGLFGLANVLTTLAWIVLLCCIC